MKQIYACLCVLLTALVLVGCVGSNQPTEPIETGFDPAAMKINGVEIEKYTIVYAQDGKYSPLRDSKYWVESGKMEDAAQQFCDALYELTGKKLPVVPEKKLETEYEIIIGKTNRKASKEAYKIGSWTKEKYAYGVQDGKLILAGGSSNACYFAGMAFLEACKAMTGSDFTAPIVKADAELITVACIGDSITDGAGQISENVPNDRNVHSYPIYLQKLLGFGYYVANYGKSGVLMTEYKFTSHFYDSIAEEPDVVLMMLGTNDYWNEEWGTKAYEQAYKDAAAHHLAQYKAKNEDVQMFVLTPPAIVADAKQQEQLGVAAQYNRDFAQENGLPVVEVYKATQQGEWVFNDGVHPQAEVYLQLAEAIYADLKDVIKTSK